MTADEEYEIAALFRDGTELIPHPVKGMVPLYDGHPPDTYLPMDRCPNCREGITMKRLWRLYKRRERLLAEKMDTHQGCELWHAYQDGIRETNREISQLTWALPSNVSSWIREQVEPRFWEKSDLNPEAYARENQQRASR